VQLSVVPLGHFFVLALDVARWHNGSQRQTPLENYALGPPLEAYGPNIRITALVDAASRAICLLAFGVAREIQDPTAWRIFFALSTLFGGVILWQLSFRAAVHESGISCQNTLLSKEMRWHEVERFYFACHQIYASPVPLGTFYRLELHSVDGQSLSLGNRIRRADDLAQTIAQITLKPLMERPCKAFRVDATSILTRSSSAPPKA
jgi:hypothetical protein